MLLRVVLDFTTKIGTFSANKTQQSHKPKYSSLNIKDSSRIGWPLLGQKRVKRTDFDKAYYILD